MKKIFFFSLLAAGAFGFSTTNIYAQSKKNPKPKMDQTTATEEKVKSTVKELDINGVHVILKPASNNVISAQLFITGGVNNYTMEKQGVENLMLAVMSDGGSVKYPKDDFHALMERKGIGIYGTAAYDYSLLSLRTLVSNWDVAWDIFQDVVINPAWDEQSFEQNKGQIVSGLKQQESDPDAFLVNMSIRKTFKGQRYEKDPSGTTTSIQNLKLEDLTSHYRTIMKAKKLLLVVVGNVTEEDLRQKVSSSLSKLPVGDADKFVSKPVAINVATINYEEREIATNYIRGLFSAPPRGTQEAIAMRVAMAMLSERLFVEVRTKRNLSYAPAASIASMFDPYSYIYVSTTKPNDAVQVMTDEIRKVKKEGFKEKELTDMKESFLTNYYMAQETNDAQAVSLGVAELVNGWEFAENFKDEVYALTLDEVNKVFKKYANAISWYYLGKKAEADEGIFLKELK
jgi:predicted Zn-dependent peptidase